jgi:hypothetical protein
MEVIDVTAHHDPATALQNATRSKISRAPCDRASERRRTPGVAHARQGDHVEIAAGERKRQRRADGPAPTMTTSFNTP